MDTLSPQDAQWTMFITKIGDYLKSINKAMTVRSFKGSLKVRNDYIALLKASEQSKDIEPEIVTFRTVDEAGNPLDLIRWVYHETEILIRHNGKVEIRGNPQKAKVCLEKLGLGLAPQAKRQ